MIGRDSKVHYLAGSCFFFNKLSPGLVLKPELADLFVSQNPPKISFSFSRLDSGMRQYHLAVWLNLNYLHHSKWITFPTQSCLVLFCASLQHSFIMWLIVLSLSSHNLHLLFCSVLSSFVFKLLVRMALFGAAIRVDSVSLLNLFSVVMS